MPCIWGSHNKSQVFIDLAILKAEQVAGVSVGSEMEGPLNIFRALIDTGAQSTCISAACARSVGLKPIGKVPVRGVSGTQFHNNYLFHVAFPVAAKSESTRGSKGVAANLHILQQPIQGAELFSGGSFEVLLGMDVISTGSLSIEGNGTFSFSF